MNKREKINTAIVVTFVAWLLMTLAFLVGNIVGKRTILNQVEEQMYKKTKPIEPKQPSFKLYGRMDTNEEWKLITSDTITYCKDTSKVQYIMVQASSR